MRVKWPLVPTINYSKKIGTLPATIAYGFSNTLRHIPLGTQRAYLPIRFLKKTLTLPTSKVTAFHKDPFTLLHNRKIEISKQNVTRADFGRQNSCRAESLIQQYESWRAWGSLIPGCRSNFRRLLRAKLPKKGYWGAPLSTDSNE